MGTRSWSWLHDSAEPKRKKGKQIGSLFTLIEKKNTPKDMLLVLDWQQRRQVDPRKQANASRFSWPSWSDKRSCCILTNRISITEREREDLSWLDVCYGPGQGSTCCPRRLSVAFHAFFLVPFLSFFMEVLVENPSSRILSYCYLIESHGVMKP